MTDEEFLIQQIQNLQNEYQKQIQPYLDRLYTIRSMHPPPPIIVDIESLDAEIRERLTRRSQGR